MVDPLISVKMTTYNHGPFIAQSIEGVLQQESSFPFELVIGEDCSTDGTREIVTDYQRRHPGIIRVVTSDANVGMVRNSRRTHKACRGRYIAFCEGDDFWHRPDKLQIQVEFLKTHPNCGMVCSDYDVYIPSQKKRIQSWNRQHGCNPAGITCVSGILRGSYYSGILTCTVLARKELIDHVIVGDPSFYSNEKQPALDTRLWVELFLLSGIGYIDEPLATYNRPEQSATRNPDRKKVLRTSIAMKEQMIFLIDKHQLPEEERQRHLQDLWRRKLKLAFYEGNQEEAEEAREHLKHLLFVERLHYIGAKHSIAKSLFMPILGLIDRDLIPTAK